MVLSDKFGYGSNVAECPTSEIELFTRVSSFSLYTICLSFMLFSILDLKAEIRSDVFVLGHNSSLTVINSIYVTFFFI